MGTWTTHANVPDTKFGSGVIGYNSKIYIAGGFSYSGGSFNDLMTYDPNTNTYDQTLSNMSISKEHFAVGIKSGIIYTAGGHNSSGFLNSCEKYNIGTDTWSSMPNLPVTAHGLNGTIYGDYFYVFDSSKVYKYDINGNSWSTPNTDTTDTIDYSVTETVGNYIWVIGGSVDRRIVRKYNPATDSWVSGTYTDAPSDVYFTASCVHSTKIYMAGGYQSQTIFKSYDTSNDTWDNTLPGMPTSRYSAAGDIVNNNFYVVGGYNGNSLNSNESYDLPILSTTNPGGDINPYKTRIQG